MANEPAYYLIRLDPPPKSIRAVRTRQEHYRRKHRLLYPRCVEISFLQEGSFTERRPDREIFREAGSIGTFVSSYPFERHSADPVVQELALHFTLAEAPRPLTAEAAAAWTNTIHCAVLPDRVSDAGARERLGGLLQAAVHPAGSSEMVRSLKLRTILYEVLAILTEQAVLQARALLQNTSRSISPYTEKAREYLDENLSRKVPVTEVADYVGISYDHMNRVFRQDMDMTLLEYANRARIRLVEQYITGDGLTLEEAGDKVGIHDVKYLSRLFHRYVGVSAAEYRRSYRDRQQL